MVDRVLDDLGLRSGVAETLGLDEDATLAAELMAALNGQWWYGFHTGREAIQPVQRVMQEVRTAMASSQLPESSADVFARRGALIPVERAYDRASLLRTLADGAPA